MTHVYFIEALCRPAVVKIGISSDVRCRLATLQTAMPFKLRFMGCVGYESTEAARKAERKLHRKLKRKRLQGEWFRLTPKTREFIVALIGGGTSIPAPTERSIDHASEPDYSQPPGRINAIAKRIAAQIRQRS